MDSLTSNDSTRGYIMGNKILPSNTRLGCFGNRQRKCINNLLGPEDKKAVKSRCINFKECAVSAAKTGMPFQHPIFSMSSLRKERDENAPIVSVPAQMPPYCVTKLLECIAFFLLISSIIIQCICIICLAPHVYHRSS